MRKSPCSKIVSKKRTRSRLEAEWTFTGSRPRLSVLTLNTGSSEISLGPFSGSVSGSERPLARCSRRLCPPTPRPDRLVSSSTRPCPAANEKRDAVYSCCRIAPVIVTLEFSPSVQSAGIFIRLRRCIINRGKIQRGTA